MPKLFTILAILFLLFVSATHLIRLLMGWRVTIHKREMPRWFSALACIVIATLAALLWWEAFGRGS